MQSAMNDAGDAPGSSDADAGTSGLKLAAASVNSSIRSLMVVREMSVVDSGSV